MQQPAPAPHHTPLATPKAAPPSLDNQQFSLEYRSTRALARAIAVDPANSYCWASAFGGVELNDDNWEVRLHFQRRDNMERKFSLSDITFLNLIALTETEGYGSTGYMYWVKEVGTRQDGLFLLDSQDAGSPVLWVGFVLSMSQDGVVHPLEVTVNTHQSCNLNMTEAPCDDDGDAGGEDDDVDKSSSDFEFDRGDYRGMKMYYKAWKREFWREEKEADSGEDTVVAKGRPEKLKPRRAAENSGPTSRAHSQPEIPKFQDFVSKHDEYCFPGDVGISDSEGEVPTLPSGRKRRLKKKKKKKMERKWYDPVLPDAHEQLCRGLCFTNVYEFRKALRNYHVRTLRNFQYHRNEPTRIIVWCPERTNGCEFFMTTSKVPHEDTFTIKKCHLDHTCGSSG
ncbi:hypothetical protein D1007_33832 [Hordeum vulgare]|nr:hypothetical protein D1007_33832 [Hordeum vulgare]